MTETQFDGDDNDTWTPPEKAVRVRIAELNREIEDMSGRVHNMGTVGLEELGRKRAELAASHSTLAQYSVARATAANTAAVEEETAARDREIRENSTWYSRRFYTSLGLVNGAALAGLAAHVMDGKAAGFLVIVALWLYAAGMCTAGLIPAILGFANMIDDSTISSKVRLRAEIKLRDWSTRLMTISASCFVVGTAAGLVALSLRAFPSPPSKPAPTPSPIAAPTKPGGKPPAPAAASPPKSATPPPHISASPPSAISGNSIGPPTSAQGVGAGR